MKSGNLKTRSVNEVGGLLRHWRDLRGKSQFDLSLDTGVSQKQISFVKSGRSVPNRRTLSIIAQALDIPLRDRNVAARGRLCPDLFRGRLGLDGNEKCDRRPKTHSAPAGAVSGDGDGPLLELTHDE